METRFCHQCGSKVAATSKFCSSCGAALQPVAPAPKIEPQPEPEIVKAPPVVFTLDTLEQQPAEPVKPATVFTLDSLEEEAPQSEPVAEPVDSAPTVVLTPEMLAQLEAPVEKAVGPENPDETSAAHADSKKSAKAKKGILVRRGVGRTILAVLVCILIFVWSFASLTVLNVRLSTTGEQASATLEDALTGMDLTQMPASLMVMNLQDPNMTLTDWIIGKVTESYQGRVNADPDDLKEYLEDSTVVPFLAQQLSDYLADIYNGTTDSIVTAAEIEAQLAADAEVIHDIFDEEMTPEAISAIAQSAIDSGALELLNTASLKENNSQIYRIVNMALSWWVIGGFGLILLLLILLLGAVNRSTLRTLGDTGITLMVVSGIWGIGGMFVMLLPKVWNSLLYSIRPIGNIVGALLKASLVPTAAAFGTGVVLLLICVLGKKIVIRSAKKQANV